MRPGQSTGLGVLITVGARSLPPAAGTAAPDDQGKPWLAPQQPVGRRHPTIAPDAQALSRNWASMRSRGELARFPRCVHGIVAGTERV